MDKISQDQDETNTNFPRKEAAMHPNKTTENQEEIDLKTPHVWFRLFILVAAFTALILGAILAIQLLERSDIIDRESRPAYTAERNAATAVDKITAENPEATLFTLDAKINDSFLSQTTDVRFALTNITELGLINDKTPVLVFLHVENNSTEKYFYLENLSLSSANSDEVFHPLLSSARAPLDEFILNFELAPLYDIAPGSSASGWAFFLASDTTDLSLDYLRPATSVDDVEAETRTILIDFTSKINLVKG
jgi:hypothetical protein